MDLKTLKNIQKLSSRLPKSETSNLSIQKKTPENTTNTARTETASQQGIVSASQLNVRQGPGTNYQRIAGLSEGSQVTILEKTGDWYRIQYGTSIGYVSAKYIKLTDTKLDKGKLKPVRPLHRVDTDSSEDSGKTGISGQSDPIGTATITVNAITVRSGAGNMFERIGGLTKGKSVPVLEKKDGWIKIQYGSEEGWIYGPFTDFDSFSSSTATGDADLAEFIRDNYPNGVNICFSYNGESSSEFHSQSKRIAKTYNTLNLSNGKLDKQIYHSITKYTELKSNILAVTAAVRKCLADHPRPGFDDSKCSVIKNLTIVCHGYSNGLNLGGGSSNHFKIGKVDDFAQVVKGYLADDVRVQLYACTTARRDGTKENWYERRGTNGKSGADILEEDPFKNGEGSFAQKLAEALGGNASVYGHTTAGHVTGNRCARVYGKDADYAPNGKHMFDVWFPQSFVAEQAAQRGKSEIEIRNSMYSYYCSNYGGDCQGRDTFIDPEGKGERMRAGWLAENP